MSSLRASAAGSVRSFRTPALAKALLALVAFSMAEWATYVAVAVYAFQEGGTAGVGLVSTLTLISAAIVAPVGGVLGDRYRRERVLLLAYAGLTLGTAATAVAILAGLPPLVVYASAVVAASLLTLVRPTHNALLPSLAPTPEALTSAYAATGAVESVSVLLGPLLATVILAAPTSYSGPGLVLAALATLLAAGTALVATVRPLTTAAIERASDRPPSVAREVAEGLRTTWQDPRPRLLVGLIGMSTVTLGVIDVAIVVLAFEVLGTGETGAGLLNVALGVGSVAGAIAAAVVAGRRRMFGVFRSSIVLTGLPVAATAVFPAAAPLTFGLSATGMSLTDVVGITMLQRLVPDAKLTRVFGVLESMFMAGEGAGALLASVSIVVLGPRWTLLAAGLLLPTLGFLVRRRIEAMDVGVRVPEREMEVLRRTAIFGVLGGPALERLARNAVPSQIAAGARAIVEGEPGDRYFAIDEGTFEVTRDGKPLGTLGPGEGFGEIALIRDVLRTATVTAVSDGRLLSLHRDEFLAALTGGAGAAAHAEARRRLDPDERGTNG